MTPLTKESSDIAERITQSYGSAFSNLSAELQNEIRKELVEKYEKYAHFLNSNFASNILSDDKHQVPAGLWELVMIDRLKNSPKVIHIDDHKDTGPDWCIQLKNMKKYYVEATYAGLPKENANSEIHRIINEMRENKESSWGNALIEEAKSRISSRIKEKLDNHESLVKSNKIGYLLLVSYAEVGCIDSYHAVKTIMSIGDLTITLDTNKPSHPIITEEYLKHQDHYKKTRNTDISTDEKYAEIQTNIFGNEKYNWVSAILFSGVKPLYLLESAINIPFIQWKKQPNDFVLVYNPTADYPLDVDLFNSATKIKQHNNQLVTEGKRIFPSFSPNN